jgi:phosphatidylglycerophosphatase C
VRAPSAGGRGPRRLTESAAAAGPSAQPHDAPPPGLALFDLDGTITRRDTLLPYLTGYLQRHPPRVLSLPRVGPVLVRYLLHRADRGEMKGALIQTALGGLSRAELSAWTEQFVRELLQHGVRDDALAAIAAHRDRGERLALLSASTELYVPAIGQALGFDDVLCTRLEWQGERLVGRLSGPNLRGAEKVRCLHELRARYPGLQITAYGDSPADIAHLLLADRGILVNGSAGARRAARRGGLTCRAWR